MQEIGITRSIISEKIVSHIADEKSPSRSLFDSPIGMYDSGVGGLSVLKEVMKQMPQEEVVYFADTARVPFGGKTPQEIIKINYEIVNFLATFGVKLIIIACGTSSAIAYPIIKEHYRIPLISLIDGAVESAVKATKNNRIGVIATQATIDSTAYERGIKALKKDIKIINAACPLFVPLIEGGFNQSQEARWTAVQYLKPLIKADIDTLILGCTHYPFLIKLIREIMGIKVELINPAENAVTQAKNILRERGLLSAKIKGLAKSKYQFFVSAGAASFQDIGSRLLEHQISTVKQIVLPKGRKRI